MPFESSITKMSQRNQRLVEELKIKAVPVSFYQMK